jgi:uncharacterized membrane protein
MSWEYLKFFHIMFAFMLVTGVSMAQYGALKARRTEDVHAFGVYLSLSKSGGMLSGMSVFAVGILGILTAWDQGWQLTGTRWLEISYVITVIGTVLPPLTLKRWGEAAGKLMPQAMQQGRVLPEQTALIASTRYRAVDTFMNTLLVLIIILMVFKPEIG